MHSGKPKWWGEAVEYLAGDPVIGQIVQEYGDGHLNGRGDIFQTLVRSIIGQQISVKAADTIYRRLKNLCGEIDDVSISSCSLEELASCGLSMKKSQYIHGIALSEEPLLPEGFNDMDDNAIIGHLVKFKGVGQWTAEMMLISSLMRPDVLSLGDLGVVRGIRALAPGALTKKDLRDVAEAWRPYRSAACWFIWRSLDPEPVEY